AQSPPDEPRAAGQKNVHPVSLLVLPTDMAPAEMPQSVSRWLSKGPDRRIPAREIRPRRQELVALEPLHRAQRAVHSEVEDGRRFAGEEGPARGERIERIEGALVLDTELRERTSPAEPSSDAPEIRRTEGKEQLVDRPVS